MKKVVVEMKQFRNIIYVICKILPVYNVSELLIHADGELVADPDEEVDEVALLLIRDHLQPVHKLLGQP